MRPETDERLMIPSFCKISCKILLSHGFKHDKRASFINSILKIKSFDLKFMIKLSDFRGLEDDLA